MGDTSDKISIIGAGSFGTALSILAAKNEKAVMLCSDDLALVKR